MRYHGVLVEVIRNKVPVGLLYDSHALQRAAIVRRAGEQSWSVAKADQAKIIGTRWGTFGDAVRDARKHVGLDCDHRWRKGNE